MITTFTPWSALAGGVLIGIASTLLLWLLGRVAGVSGIAAGVLDGSAGERGWRLAFLAGLPLGAAAWVWVSHAAVPASGISPWWLLLAGVLVGFGTRLGSGCTSGHGVCGLGRFSIRSAVAVVVFVCTAMLTTFIVRHVLGWMP